MAETLFWIMIAFHFGLGAAAKTLMDAGLYAQGVRDSMTHAALPKMLAWPKTKGSLMTIRKVKR